MINVKEGTINAAFWFHLLITILAWVGPFLISWKIMLPIYALVQLQFAVLGRCIVNKHHDLDDEKNDYSFYAFVFELMGFQPNRKKLRFFIRKISNWFLAIVTVLWQLILEMPVFLF